MVMWNHKHKDETALLIQLTPQKTTLLENCELLSNLYLCIG